MQSRSLRALLALDRFGTVAAAAQAVHLSPAAVSVQLKNLEEELGFEIFVRTGRSIALNATGYQLVPLAQEMLDLLGRMGSLSASQSLKGKISLGVITDTLTGGLPDVLKKLSLEHPDLEVHVTANKSPNLVIQVETGVLDCAILSYPPSHVQTSLVLQELYTEPIALILSADVNFVGIRRAFESFPYVAFNRDTWVGGKIESFLHQQKIDARPIMELDSHDAVLSMVRHGMGISVLPMVRGRDRKFDGLKFVELPEMSRKICLATRKSSSDNRVSEVLAAYFREFGNHPQDDV